MTERTLIVSVHPFRRTARQRERQLQAALDQAAAISDFDPHGPYKHMIRQELPAWARGVRVEKAGRLSWAVIATSHKGH